MAREPVVRLLEDLVAIPSMNPMGRKAEAPGFLEKELAEFVLSFLRKEGIDAESYEIAPGRPNVEARIDARAKQTLLLESHLDTVHAENMKIEPFSPVIRDGRLYGRGSCDTKGSLAAFVSAVVSLLRKGRKLKYNIRFLFVSDEEYQFRGAEAAVRRSMDASFGIVGEPTQLAIVRAHKGVTRWKVHTRGVAAHAAYPQQGNNAIYLMVPVLERLERYARELSAQKPHPLLGVPSLSIGVIEGGQAVNVVPDRCTIEVDRRSVPGETTESILQPVRELLNGLREVEIEPPFLSVAGMEVSEKSEIVRFLADSCTAVLRSARVEAAHYATDAGVYNRAGVPTVVFGPGNISQAHTESEFIDLDQLEKAVGILQHFISS